MMGEVRLLFEGRRRPVSTILVDSEQGASQNGLTWLHSSSGELSVCPSLLVWRMKSLSGLLNHWRLETTVWCGLQSSNDRRQTCQLDALKKRWKSYHYESVDWQTWSEPAQESFSSFRQCFNPVGSMMAVCPIEWMDMYILMNEIDPSTVNT